MSPENKLRQLAGAAAVAGIATFSPVIIENAFGNDVQPTEQKCNPFLPAGIVEAGCVNQTGGTNYSAPTQGFTQQWGGSPDQSHYQNPNTYQNYQVPQQNYNSAIRQGGSFEDNLAEAGGELFGIGAIILGVWGVLK